MRNLWQDVRFAVRMLAKSRAFTLVAMTASYILARRATKVDPMVALRYE